MSLAVAHRAPFSISRCQVLAAKIFSEPCFGTEPRVEGKGSLVATFFLPLELCQNENSHSHGKSWVHASRKNKLWAVMRRQFPVVRPAPLAGRPLIRQIRFSSSEPDVAGEGFKTAIDFLCVPRVPKTPKGRFKRGLGFLVDDAPRFVERVAFWEYAAPGLGFCLLEIWAGGEHG